MASETKELIQDVVDVLREGGAIEVVFATFNGTSVYQSRIERIESDHMLLREPARGDLIIPLKPGDELTLRYKGVDAIYEFKTEVLGMRRFGPRELRREYAVAFPGQGVRLQRRQFYRMHEESFARVRRVRVEANGSASRLFPYGEWEEANLMDISGGGVCLLHNTRFEVNGFAVCEFTIYSKGKEKMYQEIIRFVRIKEAAKPGVQFGDYVFRSGAYFFTMDDAAREEVIQYIFNRQLKGRAVT